MILRLLVLVSRNDNSPEPRLARDHAAEEKQVDNFSAPSLPSSNVTMLQRNDGCLNHSLLVSLISIFQAEFLDLTFDVEFLSKLDGVLAVFGSSRRVTLKTETFLTRTQKERDAA